MGTLQQYFSLGHGIDRLFNSMVPSAIWEKEVSFWASLSKPFKAKRTKKNTQLYTNNLIAPLHFFKKNSRSKHLFPDPLFCFVLRGKN